MKVYNIAHLGSKWLDITQVLGIPIHGKVSLNRGCVHWTVSTLVRMNPENFLLLSRRYIDDDVFKL